MSASRTEPAGRVARWVLLACTLFGLASMHTLGHAGVRMAADSGPMQVVRIAGAPSMVAAPLDCPAGHCDGHGGGGMSGWSVCLAVLTGLVAIVLLAVLLSWASSGRRARHEPAGVAAGPRAPPRRPAGLLVASVAVLRI